MTERYLQSLAILLAGLFSAERLRPKGLSVGLSAPSANAGQEADDAAAERTKANQH